MQSLGFVDDVYKESSYTLITNKKQGKTFSSRVIFINLYASMLFSPAAYKDRSFNVWFRTNLLVFTLVLFYPWCPTIRKGDITIWSENFTVLQAYNKNRYTKRVKIWKNRSQIQDHNWYQLPNQVLGIKLWGVSLQISITMKLRVVAWLRPHKLHFHSISSKFISAFLPTPTKTITLNSTYGHTED